MSLIKVIKYQSLNHTSLYIIECCLTDLISFKYDFLLNKLNHEMNNLREILDKALIEIAEVNKELYLSEIDENKSFDNHLYLLRIHL